MIEKIFNIEYVFSTVFVVLKKNVGEIEHTCRSLYRVRVSLLFVQILFFSRNKINKL